MECILVQLKRDKGVPMEDINLMREYVRLVECRNFTLVAKEFFLSQPTVSKRLKRMEDELGVTLIERGSKSVAPTEEGMLAYQAFKDIIARYDALETSLDVLNRERTGILSIGVLYHGVDELTAPFVSEFKKVCPNVKVRYVPCQNYQVAERLASEEIDVGFAGIALEGGEAVAFAPDARFSYIPIRKQVERCAVKPQEPLGEARCGGCRGPCRPHLPVRLGRGHRGRRWPRSCSGARGSLTPVRWTWCP